MKENLKTEKEMEMEKNITIMENYYMKENFKMEKEMEMEKNMVMENYYMKESILMEKYGKVKVLNIISTEI